MAGDVIEKKSPDWQAGRSPLTWKVHDTATIQTPGPMPRKALKTWWARQGLNL